MKMSRWSYTKWLAVQAIFLSMGCGHLRAADGTLAWSQLWGSPSDDYAFAACADAADHVYVAGYAKGGFDGQTNAGAEDLCLTRFTRDGARVWSRIWGSSAGDFGYGVVADTGAYVYVAGYTAGAFDGQTNTGGKDLCLTKFSAAGAKQWTRIWGSPLDESGWAASADGAGNIYVAGETFGGFDGQTNAGYTDLCLTKFNAAGVKQWTRMWGSADYDLGYGVCAAQPDAVYVAGATRGAFGGQSNAGSYDFCLTKFNAAGSTLWTRIWGSTSYELGRNVRAAVDGSVYVVGHTLGAFDGQAHIGQDDACISKFSADGTRLWSRIWGSIYPDFGYGIALDAAQNVHVAGVAWGNFAGQTNAGVSDLFLTKFSSSGTAYWSRIWGSALYDYGLAAVVDARADVFVAGRTDGAFGGQTNSGGSDFCLTKFGSAAREIAITSVPFTVFLPDTTAAIAGTNADSIASGSDMWWLNTSTNGVAGTFVAPITRAWSVAAIPLAFGPNLVTVGGTNVVGAAVMDTIAIELALPEPAGLLLLLFTIYTLHVIIRQLATP